MQYRAESLNEQSQKILSHWRKERAFRVGHILGMAGFILSSITTLVDIVYGPGWILLSDLLLVVGCAATWYWSQPHQRKPYFWIPLYLTYWFACLPTYWVTGGIASPFLGIGIAVLYLLGEVLDTKGRSLFHIAFAAAHIPLFIFADWYLPRASTDELSTLLIAIVTGANIAGLYVGIRALLRTEKELSLEFTEHGAQLREAQSIAKVGSWSWSIPEDKITWSDELFRMFEIKREDFDPSYAAYLARLSPEQRDFINGLIDESAKSGSDFIFEHSIDTSTGRKHIFARGRVLKDRAGRTVGMVGTSQDITERKEIEAELRAAHEKLEKRVEERTLQLEQSLEREKASRAEAERASKAKMQFLANMSHEIRTPMNSILGFSEILATEQCEPEKVREYLTRIRANGSQLLHLIDDILDLSKFEAGEIPIQKSTVDVRAVITNIVKSFEPALAAKNIGLEVRIDDQIPLGVSLDETRTVQVVSNLISNAIKFSETGSIELALSLSNQRLIIDVKDTGVGISEEQRNNLFQPFSQGDSTIARKFGGSGLGLALSRRISEAMGGSLELKWSAPGKGSHFVFEAPLEASVPALSKTANTLGANAAARAGRTREILLAEDSPDNAFLITHFIEPLGYKIDVVGDGLQAVAAAARKDYDCILMDIQMPGMDGLEATRRIRAAGYTKPIIALTAHALPAEAEKSLAAGCNDHLTKPSSRQQLADALSEQLGSD